MQKAKKILKLTNAFCKQVKLAEISSQKLDKILDLLKKVKNGSDEESAISLGVEVAGLSEEEIINLVTDVIGETGNETVIKNDTEEIIDAIEAAYQAGQISEIEGESAAQFLHQGMNKALKPGDFPSMINKIFPEAKSEVKKQLSEKNENNKPVTQPQQDQANLAGKYYDALEDFESFVASNASGFNSNLKTKLSAKMEQFQSALDAYQAQKKEMPIHIAQQWAAPILLIIASLIATAKANYAIQAGNLWNQITKASYGQIPTGFSAGSWLTMRQNPYHQASQKDVADLAALGIKVELGEWILPVEAIKRNPSFDQKAQMDAKKLTQDAAKGGQWLGKKMNPLTYFK
jgi:hypothetical protein